jgi:gliding motility-associated-like protein
MYKVIGICLLLFAIPSAMEGQCLVINEIMINGPGPNDGQNSPDTEEWIELYNACTSPLDIGCYVLTDGDYGITIPSGTVLQPGAYYTIGSVNAGFDVDLDLANCGCAGGTNVGVLTNGDEQMLLFDDNYTLIDGVIWGDGQLPINFYQVAYAGCIGHNYSFNDASLLEELPSGGGQGCVMHRSCDGSEEWIEDCSGGTPGTTNGGAPNYSLNLPDAPICVGDCYAWSLEDPADVQSIAWNIEGALAPNSTDIAPLACYDAAGTFAIEAIIISACGIQEISIPNAIVVESLEVEIEASSNISPCPGDAPQLSTTAIGTYQWYLDNQPIANATASTYDAVATGNYTLQVTSGSCSAQSNSVFVTYEPLPILEINSSSGAILCPGTSTELTATAPGANIEWFFENTAIGTGPTVIADAAGAYTFVYTISTCSYTSDPLEVFYENAIDPVLTASSLAPCPDEVVTLSIAPGGSTVEWLRDAIVFQTTTSPSIATTQSGAYTAQVITENGCVYPSNALDIVFLDIDAPAVIIVGNDASICPGETVVLEVEGNYDGYTWYMGNQAVGNGGQYIASLGGDYSVEATALGCTLTSGNVAVALLPLPTVSPAPGSTIVSCVAPFAIPFSSNGTLTWTLNEESYVPPTDQTLSIAGLYSIVATSADGCIGTTYEFELTFIDPPAIEIIPSDATPCDGEAVALTANGLYNQWIWNNGVIGNTAEVNQSGTYEVTGTALNGCTQTHAFTIEFSPLPELTAATSMASNCIDGALLHAESNGDFFWYDSQNNLIGEGNDIVFDPDNDQVIRLASTLGECTSELWTLVTVDCELLYIPNAITPNGDGINDVFKVVIDHWSSYHLEIFDRWGTMIFESIDPSEAWTGGVDSYFVGDGVYHYRLSVLNEDGLPMGDSITHTGHIVVVR